MHFLENHGVNTLWAKKNIWSSYICIVLYWSGQQSILYCEWTDTDRISPPYLPVLGHGVPHPHLPRLTECYQLTANEEQGVNRHVETKLPCKTHDVKHTCN